MTDHEPYMHRCLQLARLGAGTVAPNPMVGAVLVHNGRIIGEGFHQLYGQAHAEVNCINSIKDEDRHLVSESTMYVSLEPCAHFGKTPPCADLIARHQIPRVVVGCRDPFEAVNGKGIEKLQQAGIEVLTGIAEKDCIELNKRFFIFHQQGRPYIILKWAQSANGCIACADKSPLAISNDFTNRLVHRWRSEEAAIMVGTNTALADNPSLTTRLWSGTHPQRILIDLGLKVPHFNAIFSGDDWKTGDKPRTIVVNQLKSGPEEHVLYCQVSADSPLLPELMKQLHALNIQSLIVEGGTKLLASFIEAGLWDEARIITNKEMIIPNGYPAPVLKRGKLVHQEKILSDELSIFN